jgi:hypothetical protein
MTQQIVWKPHVSLCRIQLVPAEYSCCYCAIIIGQKASLQTCNYSSMLQKVAGRQAMYIAVQDGGGSDVLAQSAGGADVLA